MQDQFARYHTAGDKGKIGAIIPIRYLLGPNTNRRSEGNVRPGMTPENIIEPAENALFIDNVGERFMQIIVGDGITDDGPVPRPAACRYRYTKRVRATDPRHLLLIPPGKRFQGIPVPPVHIGQGLYRPN